MSPLRALSPHAGNRPLSLPRCTWPMSSSAPSNRTATTTRPSSGSTSASSTRAGFVPISLGGSQLAREETQATA